MTRTNAHVRRIALVAVIGLVVTTRSVRADSRTDFLVGRLQAEDFRVRTNAALALGQTGDPAVVNPLCTALSDSSDVVRQAVAVALQRLARPAATGCLKDRLSVETSDAVKRQIAKALEASQPTASDTSSPVPHVMTKAKYYVAFSAITNLTTRPDNDIGHVVVGSLRDKLEELGDYQIAPDKETLEQARVSVNKRKLRGYYLSVRVEKLDYSDGNLRVRVKVAVFTYPGKDLRGEVPSGLTQSGVSPGDTAAEDNLLRLAAARAAELFAQNFP